MTDLSRRYFGMSNTDEYFAVQITSFIFNTYIHYSDREPEEHLDNILKMDDELPTALYYLILG